MGIPAARGACRCRLQQSPGGGGLRAVRASFRGTRLCSKCTGVSVTPRRDSPCKSGTPQAGSGPASGGASMSATPPLSLAGGCGPRPHNEKLSRPLAESSLQDEATRPGSAQSRSASSVESPAEAVLLSALPPRATSPANAASSLVGDWPAAGRAPQLLIGRSFTDLPPAHAAAVQPRAPFTPSVFRHLSWWRRGLGRGAARAAQASSALPDRRLVG